MRVGLEREALLFDKNKKPIKLNENNLKNGTCLDFADHQIELVSKVCNSEDELLNNMYQLLDQEVVTKNHLWPLSQPGVIDYETTIEGCKTEEQKKYRRGLMEKYPMEMLLISGIHFNIDLEQENDEEVFELMKKVYTFLPIILPFYSFTPRGEILSFRNTHKFGYYNEMNLNLDYSNIASYNQSIQKAVDNKLIQSAKELYAKIRFKNKGNGSYLELRFIDINPFDRLGITKEMLELLCTFVKWVNKQELVEFDQTLNLNNSEEVCMNFNLSNQYKINGFEDTLKNHIIKFLDENNFAKIKADFEANNLDSDKLRNMLITSTEEEIGQKYMYHQKDFEEYFPDKNMELSTKILMKKAQELDLDIEILDEYENVIKIDGELIVQATKTNRDRYANILMMENKYMTKQILEKHGILVPSGIRVHKNDVIDFDIFIDKKMVVKPQDTNFGIGITILEKGSNKDQIQRAIDLAFSACDLVLIEEFHPGIEYRFLVIDDKCVSIVRRVPSNVIGDGVHTIEELVKIKNLNPLRSKGYVTPVELVTLGEYEINFLSLQGLEKSYIPKEDETIYLRENSNVSTGGDTIELFEQIPQFYKDEAVKAAKSLDVEICGLDFIIEDLFKYEYTIIEANFNPAIQMHTFPLIGMGKDVASDVLNCILKEKK